MWPKSERLEKKARIVARTDTGPIIEVTFKGKAWDGCSDELFRFIGRVLQDMGPAGIVMNLGEFKIGSWDDIGPVFIQLIGKRAQQFLPFCIVAKKRTTECLKTMFMAMQETEIIGAGFFSSAEDALRYLENRLREARPDTSSQH